MDLDDSRPIWVQLADDFRHRIVSGQWPPGTKVPSVRELAADTGVTPTTVQRALGALDGGTLATKEFAEKAGKPFFVVQVDDGLTVQMAADVLAWLQAHDIKTLNVAGPRESKRPGIYWLTLDLLENLGTALRGA